LLDTQNKTRR